jgi:hypothetical protein
MSGLRPTFLVASITLYITIVSGQNTCQNGTFRPFFNGSYDANSDGFNVAQLYAPNTEQFGCFEQAIVHPFDSFVFDDDTYNLTNFTLTNYTWQLSAKYYCNENGTRLTSVYYNESSCEGDSFTHTTKVPYEMDEMIIDCVCQESNKYIEVEKYNNVSTYNEAQCTDEDPDVVYMMSGTCFGYYDDDMTKKSMYVECNDKDQANILEYSDSLSCDGSLVYSDYNITDGFCMMDTLNVSLRLTCSGGVGSTSTSESGAFKLNKDDIFFLLIAFFYLIFVIVFLSIMFCYMTGKICVKKNKVGPSDQDDDGIVEALPVEKKEEQSFVEGEQQHSEQQGGVEGETYQSEVPVEGGGDINNQQYEEATEGNGEQGGGEEQPELQQGTNGEGEVVTEEAQYEEQVPSAEDAHAAENAATVEAEQEANEPPAENAEVVTSEEPPVGDEDPTVIEDGAGAI